MNPEAELLKINISFVDNLAIAILVTAVIGQFLVPFAHDAGEDARGTIALGLTLGIDAARTIGVVGGLIFFLILVFWSRYLMRRLGRALQ